MTKYIFLLFSLSVFSQTTNLTSSPYSLYGLGKINEYSNGVLNSLGYGGISMNNDYELNILNPASLGNISQNAFILDVGVKGEINHFGDNTDSDKKPTFNFSNISFGLSIDKKSGVSLSLIPYSEVGYVFQGIVNSFEGNQDTYFSNILGSGGVNVFNINYGRKINKKINLGLTFKYFFGSINQTEIVYLDDDNLFFESDTNYKGLGLSTGIQYKIINNLILSNTITFPTNLIATKDLKVSKLVDQNYSIINETYDEKINSFNIPYEITFGFKYDLKKYSFIGDFKQSFWSILNQTDDVGKFVDNYKFNFGIERQTINELNFKSKLRYRVGFSYDQGNLLVNNNRISNMSYTAGISIPINSQKNTYLNFSYAYNSKGLVSNTLIKEKSHSISLNLNLFDIWFKKRVIE